VVARFASVGGMLVNVQALRAVAAFLVVFVHLQALALLLGWGPNAFVFGNSGVDLFFVISGAIMVVTVRRRPQGPQTFLANRIARIAPLYWLITAVVFCAAQVAPSLFDATHPDGVALAKSLFFIPFQRADGRMAPVVFVGWTLNYEMAFYLLFAAGLAFRRWQAGVAVVLGLLLSAVIAGLLAHPAGGLARFYTAPLVLEFGLGMIIGGAIGRLNAVRAPTALVLVVDAVMAGAILTGPVLWPQADRFVAFGLPSAILVLSAIHLEETGRVVRSPWARRLGDASYSTYLSHFFVTQAVIKTAVVLGLAAPLAIGLLIPVIFVLVAAAGLATYAMAERPLIGWTKRLLRRAGGAAPVVTASVAVKVEP
jgi:peptidoglycan/LPS O-acetylase OafA/YrhL